MGDIVANRSSGRDYLVPGILLSLVLHGILLLSYKGPQPIEKAVRSVSIRLAPQRTKKKQIVTPPDKQIETKLAKQDAFQSDKNVIVKKQQIQRGMPDAAQIVSKIRNLPQQSVPTQSKHKPKAPQPTKEQKSKQEKSKQGNRAAGALKLALSHDELRDQFKVAPTPEVKPFKQNTERDFLMDYKAFSRPTGSGARFLGERGSADHLPNLPDGDITLLNTKANKFAVFVRRVATQVFSQLRSSGWQNLSASDVHSISDFSVVRAVLSKQGELLSVRLEKPSGSRSFDLVLRGAVNIGAGDPHPPAEAAAADGNIHFLFYSKSWTRMGSSGRRGGVSEKRWLLLATGLE